MDVGLICSLLSDGGDAEGQWRMLQRLRCSGSGLTHSLQGIAMREEGDVLRARALIAFHRLGCKVSECENQDILMEFLKRAASGEYEFIREAAAAVIVDHLSSEGLIEFLTNDDNHPMLNASVLLCWGTRDNCSADFVVDRLTRISVNPGFTVDVRERALKVMMSIVSKAFDAERQGLFCREVLIPLLDTFSLSETARLLSVIIGDTVSICASTIQVTFKGKVAWSFLVYLVSMGSGPEERSDLWYLCVMHVLIFLWVFKEYTDRTHPLFKLKPELISVFYNGATCVLRSSAEEEAMWMSNAEEYYMANVAAGGDDIGDFSVQAKLWAGKWLSQILKECGPSAFFELMADPDDIALFAAHGVFHEFDVPDERIEYISNCRTVFFEARKWGCLIDDGRMPEPFVIAELLDMRNHVGNMSALSILKYACGREEYTPPTELCIRVIVMTLKCIIMPDAFSTENITLYIHDLLDFVASCLDNDAIRRVLREVIIREQLFLCLWQCMVVHEPLVSACDEVIEIFRKFTRFEEFAEPLYNQVFNKCVHGIRRNSSIVHSFVARVVRNSSLVLDPFAALRGNVMPLVLSISTSLRSWTDDFFGVLAFLAEDDALFERICDFFIMKICNSSFVPSNGMRGLADLLLVFLQRRNDNVARVVQWLGRVCFELKQTNYAWQLLITGIVAILFLSDYDITGILDLLNQDINRFLSQANEIESFGIDRRLLLAFVVTFLQRNRATLKPEYAEELSQRSMLTLQSFVADDADSTEYGMFSEVASLKTSVKCLFLPSRDFIGVIENGLNIVTPSTD